MPFGGVSMRYRQIVLFHASYRLSAKGDLEGGPVEPNWHAAFSSAGTGAAVAGEVARLLQLWPPLSLPKEASNRYARNVARKWCTFATADAVLVGLQAHVRFDLPRALAAAYLQERTGAEEFDEFKDDFDELNQTIFTAAASDLSREIKRHCRGRLDPGRSRR